MCHEWRIQLGDKPDRPQLSWALKVFWGGGGIIKETFKTITDKKCMQKTGNNIKENDVGAK